MSDIDDLLDEALEQLDDQDREREERKEAETKAHEEAAAQLMTEEGLMGSGADKELLDVLGKLMSGIGADGTGAPPAAGEQDLDAIHKSLEKVITDLQKDCNTTEEKDQLAQCTEMLTKLRTTDTTPHEPTQEEIENMQKAMAQILQTGGEAPDLSAPPPVPPLPDDADESQKQVHAMMEQMQKQHEELMKNGGAAAATAGDDEKDSEAAAEMQQAEMQNLLAHILQPEVICAPLRASYKAYPIWFEKHTDGVSQEEVARYKRQYNKIGDVLGLLEKNKVDKAISDDATNEDRQALDQFVVLIEELQSEGAPPDALQQIIETQQKEEEQLATAAAAVTKKEDA